MSEGLDNTVPFPRRNTPASRPVERLPMGARVGVRLAVGTLDLWLAGVVVGRTMLGPALYDVDLGQDGMRLVRVPEARLRLEPGDAA